MKRTTAYIGLGSNVGNGPRRLLEALKMLAGAASVDVRHVSQFIRTEPAGGPEDQPKYTNAVVEVRTTLSPQQLLAALHDVEARLGRDRAAETRWGPRTCDLDILLMGEIIQNAEGLTIPHPRMHERLFVLQPLAQIAPDAIHPVFNKTAAELLAELEAGSGDADR